MEDAAARPGQSFAALLRDAAIAAGVAALLALPLLGLKLDATLTGLRLDYRLSWVLIAALAVFAGRLAISLAARHAGPAVSGWMRERTQRLRLPRNLAVMVGWGMIVIAVLLPWMPFTDRNLMTVSTLVLIYVMLGCGLNIVVGLAGLLDLGYVAFYAIGAYSFALLSQTFGLSFWICLPLAGVLAAFMGILLGFPVLRLRGDYLAIVTLGFGEIIRIILINWQHVTGGPNGIMNIPRATLFGLHFESAHKAAPGSTGFAEFFGLAPSPNYWLMFLYYMILLLAVGVSLFAQRMRKLPTGRAWEALREDEIACRSLGINPVTVKLSAFAIGAAFAGIAGCFFATRQGFISPESFVFRESAVILAIVVLGGMGSQIGIVLAAILLIGLPESPWLRGLVEYRMLAFGGVMVLIMLWRPQGLLARRTPTVLLDPGEAGK